MFLHRLVGMASKATSRRDVVGTYLTRLAGLLFAAASVATAQEPEQATARLAPLPEALPRTHKPSPTGPAISVEDLKTRLYIFADDSMLGRAAGDIGNLKATAYLAAEAKRIGLQPMGDSGTYFQTVPTEGSYPMRNVVALLAGSDPALRHQYIVLGAHSDHLGVGEAVDHDSLRVYNHYLYPQGIVSRLMAPKQPTDSEWRDIKAEVARLRKLHPGRQDSIRNGADDDGSGSVALLEIAQALKAKRVHPKRSILFIWHTDEEGSFSGAKQLIDHPPVPLDSIVVELTADMIGRGGASDRVGGGPQFLQITKQGCLSSALDTLLGAVNRAGGHHLQLSEGQETRTVDGGEVTLSSDYTAYLAKGIPIAFFFTDLHPDYHQATDEPQYIDYEHLAKVTRFIKDVAVKVANLDRAILCRSQAP